MIACISPADSNAGETIETLKYANRARNNRNKAVINRDPVAAEMQRLRSQIEQLQGELHFVSSGGAWLKEFQAEMKQLEAQNGELQVENMHEVLSDRNNEISYLKSDIAIKNGEKRTNDKYQDTQWADPVHHRVGQLPYPGTSKSIYKD